MKKIMFCGGGSAGHVIPNVALIDELKGKYKISYCGTNGIEKNICNEHGINFFEYNAVKFVRGKVLCNFLIPFKLYKSVKQAKKIIKEQKPDLLFCKGGYVCLPACLAAKKLKIPVITHESDVCAGLANKIIARHCTKVLCAFPKTAKKFKNGIYSGTPIRRSLFNRDRTSALKFFGLENRPTVLIFGGGSGSSKINEYVRSALFDLCKTFNVLHVCGKGNFVDCNINGYKQMEFISDMGLAYACADVVVARCGANSAWEITALKIPALYIPLQNKRTRGDQIKNAEYFLSLGVCNVLKEINLSKSSLIDGIVNTFKDENIKSALAKLNYERANNKIISHICSNLNT